MGDCCVMGPQTDIVGETRAMLVLKTCALFLHSVCTCANSAETGQVMVGIGSMCVSFTGHVSTYRVKKAFKCTSPTLDLACKLNVHVCQGH